MRFLLLALACMVFASFATVDHLKADFGVALTEIANSHELTESQHQYLFSRYVDAFEKTYESREFFLRYNTFKDNLKKILEHNSKPNTTFRMAVNHFTDQTLAEFRRRLGLRARTTPLRTLPIWSPNVPERALPEKVDWRVQKQTVVGPVKDQKMCGSCWAFSTTAATEGFAVLSGQVKEYTPLSEQQLVSCDKTCFGCAGGLMTNALEYLKEAGHCTDKSYPYTATDSECQKCEPVVKIGGYQVIEGTVAALKAAIAQGPVAVAVSAGNMAFMSYTSGIITDANLCPAALDHGVAAVGYGSENGTEYFIVRNSWGQSWGEEGYVRIATQGNVCGIVSEGYNCIPTI